MGARFGTATRPPLLDEGTDSPGAKYKSAEQFGAMADSKKPSAPQFKFGSSVRQVHTTR
jgi:hypothetical protein